ncbi:hypothetical protein OROHE_017274 [Orobanche hederae]
MVSQLVDVNWIPRDFNFRVNTPNFLGLQNFFVRDLFDTDSRSWNRELIESLFWDQDSDPILKIPLPHFPSQDTIIWHFSPNGSYTVKNGYRFFNSINKPCLNRNLAGPSGVNPSPSWNFLWSLKIPSKIKIFLWRLLKNSLPTRSNINSRGIDSVLNCVLCDGDVESLEHIFFFCPFARADLGAVRKNLDNDQFEKFAIFCWSIWTHRNKKLHNQEVGDPEMEVQITLRLIDSVHLTFRRSSSIDRSQPWLPPQTSFIKVNFDAAFSPSLGKAMAGIVARDSSGKTVCWRTRKLDNGGSAEHAEAFAAWHAILLAKERGWKQVVFEGDCWSIIQSLRGTQPILNTAGLFIEECRKLKSSFQSLEFLFIHREGNELAHRLASDFFKDCEGCDLPFHLM